MKPMATRTAKPAGPRKGYTRVSDSWHILNLTGRIFFGTTREQVMDRAGAYLKAQSPATGRAGHGR